MTPEGFSRIELPCRDVQRQREFYAGVMTLKLLGPGGLAFDLGGVALVLRARGDALFPEAGGPGAMLAFAVPPEELDRWHRRLMMKRAAILAAPHDLADGRRALHCADAEGNVIEIFCGTGSGG
ncbi:MAG: glyoxalase [Rhodospirillales bacterium]|nr:glyoxalase [Rhodospirillales bacterium]MDB5383927.1 glyoxalase [Rhodospirillales bacterium]